MIQHYTLLGSGSVVGCMLSTDPRSALLAFVLSIASEPIHEILRSAPYTARNDRNETGAAHNLVVSYLGDDGNPDGYEEETLCAVPSELVFDCYSLLVDETSNETDTLFFSRATRG